MIISIASGSLALFSMVITAINHKRIRSSCCGKKVEVSMDIENTTPV